VIRKAKVSEKNWTDVKTTAFNMPALRRAKVFEIWPRKLGNDTRTHYREGEESRGASDKTWSDITARPRNGDRRNPAPKYRDRRQIRKKALRIRSDRRIIIVRQDARDIRS